MPHTFPDNDWNKWAEKIYQSVTDCLGRNKGDYLYDHRNPEHSSPLVPLKNFTNLGEMINKISDNQCCNFILFQWA